SDCRNGPVRNYQELSGPLDRSPAAASFVNRVRVRSVSRRRNRIWNSGCDRRFHARGFGIPAISGGRDLPTCQYRPRGVRSNRHSARDARRDYGTSAQQPQRECRTCVRSTFVIHSGVPRAGAWRLARVGRSDTGGNYLRPRVRRHAISGFKFRRPIPDGHTVVVDRDGSVGYAMPRLETQRSAARLRNRDHVESIARVDAVSLAGDLRWIVGNRAGEASARPGDAPHCVAGIAQPDSSHGAGGAKSLALSGDVHVRFLRRFGIRLHVRDDRRGRVSAGIAGAIFPAAHRDWTSIVLPDGDDRRRVSARVPDELFRLDRYDGAGVRRDREAVPVLQRAARLARRISYWKRYRFERSVREPSSGDGESAWVEPGA